MRLCLPALTAALAAVFTWSPAFAQSAAVPNDPALLVPIDAFVAAVVAHAPQSFAASFTPGASILDDVPPDAFPGPNAPARWYAAFESVVSSSGMSVTYLGHGSPRYEHVAGDRAYVVLPASFVYSMGGKPYADSAAWTFALEKSAGTWKIAMWSWSLLTSTSE